MIDLTPTIQAKSDQLNADDLAEPKTIKITEVKAGNNEQPICIHYEGDNGRPYKPCKTMRRVLVRAWGKDGTDYAGRQMTLFNDPSVTWAGQKVGGIRISHLSHIKSELIIPLVVSRGKKTNVKIKKWKPASQTIRKNN